MYDMNSTLLERNVNTQKKATSTGLWQYTPRVRLDTVSALYKAPWVRG